jgi:hypothetical protein
LLTLGEATVTIAGMGQNCSGFTPETFEEFTRVLALKVFGPGVIPFGNGPDGGREATFEGKVPYPFPLTDEWSGYGVIQAKCKERIESTQKDQEWALVQLKKELDEFVASARRTRKPEYYVFVTNVEFSSAANGGLDKANRLIESYYQKLPLRGHAVWDCNRIETFLKIYADLRLAFPSALLPGDALALMLVDRLVNQGKAGSATAATLEKTSDVRAAVEEWLRQTSAGLDVGAEPTVYGGIRTHLNQVPVPLVSGSPRTETVGWVYELMGQHNWVALYGDPCAGKTQLVNLVTRGDVRRRHWMGFRGMESGHARVIFRGILQENSTEPNATFENQCRRFCESRRGGVVVLDDLPRMGSGDPLLDDLAVFAAESGRAQCQILSTSLYQLPLSLLQGIGNLLEELRVPPFTGKEGGELLKSLGAPDSILTDARLHFLAAISKGHPLLLAGIARQLKPIGWKFDERAFEELLRGAHTTSIADEVFPRLLKTVPVPARDLLRRLGLIQGSFPAKYVGELAQVSPQIPRAQEQLQSLLGFCLQRDGPDRIAVAAVFESWISKDLDANVRKKCNAKLGALMVNEGNLDQWSALRAIGHFYAGGEFNRAGAILLSGLRSLSDAVQKYKGKVSTAFVSMWRDKPLPHEMKLGLRASIRGLQISILNRLSEDIDWLVTDFRSLLQQVSPDDALPVFAGIIQAVDAVAKTNADLAFDLLKRAFAVFPDAERYAAAHGRRLPKALGVERMLWVAVSWVNQTGHLSKWMLLLESLEPGKRDRLRRADSDGDLSMALANKLWLNESERPQEQQQWTPVEEELAQAALTAKRLGWELLWANLIRSVMVVNAEYRRDLDGTLAIGQAAFSAASGDPTVQFLLSECLGRQLYFNGRSAEALTWLTQAINQPTTAYRLTRAYATVYASTSSADDDLQNALRLMNDAATLMRGIAKGDHGTALEKLEFAKILCELALAQWATGDLHAAYLTLDEVGGRLFRAQTENNDWKEVVVLYCHLLGYLRGIAVNGSPPEVDASGGSYSAPRRGVFMTSNPGRAGFYSKTRENMRFIALADYAEAVGEQARAVTWAREGMLAAKARGPSWTIGHLAWYVIADELMRDRFDAACDLTYEAAEFWAASKARQIRGEDDVAAIFDPDTELRREDVEILHGWQGYLALPVIVGMAFRMGIVSISEPQNFLPNCRSVVDICRRLATQTPQTALWNSIAQVFEMIYSVESTPMALLRFGDQSDAEDYKPVKIAAYLGATIIQRGEPAEAAHVQLSVFPFIAQYLRFSPGIYRIGLEFIFRYWMNQLDKSPFLFRGPTLVRQRITESQNLSERKRGQALFRAVADAFNKPFHPGAREWLRDTSTVVPA